MRLTREGKARRFIDLSARLFTGIDAPVWDCVVMELSDNGARIAVDAAEDIPDRFTLLCNGRDRASHRCLVVWRLGRQIAVKFDESV
jgi:PilZ domain